MIILCMHSVPPPTSMTITTDQDNPIRPIGSSVNVTCVTHVDLSSELEIDVSLTMNIRLTDPNSNLLGSKLFTVLQSNHTYHSTAIISSFGRNNSGLYKCSVNISSTGLSVFLVEHNSSKSVQITTGKPLLLS